jgi:hypothetical protein
VFGSSRLSATIKKWRKKRGSSIATSSSLSDITSPYKVDFRIKYVSDLVAVQTHAV